jgi:hypothetical protein
MVIPATIIVGFRARLVSSLDRQGDEVGISVNA